MSPLQGWGSLIIAYIYIYIYIYMYAIKGKKLKTT